MPKRVADAVVGAAATQVVEVGDSLFAAFDHLACDEQRVAHLHLRKVGSAVRDAQIAETAPRRAQRAGEIDVEHLDPQDLAVRKIALAEHAQVTGQSVLIELAPSRLLPASVYRAGSTNDTSTCPPAAADIAAAARIVATTQCRRSMRMPASLMPVADDP
ncbi:MAG: hypothetical protein ABIV63_09340, partial [Caldimonas sp.]